MTGYMYILECGNGQYYVGSTQDLKARIRQHQDGEGANFSKKLIPIKLVYFEEFDRIDEAFRREKQVQGWSRKKKEALIFGTEMLLHSLAACKTRQIQKIRTSLKKRLIIERSRIDLTKFLVKSHGR